MTNWEKEIWTRIYGKVTKNAKFIYTFSREEASLQKYPHSLNGIAAAIIKMPIPKKPSSPKLSQKSLTLQQPDLKRVHSQVPPMSVVPIPIEINLTEDGSDTYLMRLVSEKGQEIAQIKANRLEPLKRIVEDIKDQRQQLENIGLPLTIEPHDKAASSLLSTKGEQEISLRGMVNLLILLLLCYHIRMIVQSLQQHDFVLRDVVRSASP